MTMKSAGKGADFRILETDARPIIPLEGVFWASCRFQPGPAARLVHEDPGGPVILDPPEDLARAVDKRRSEFLAGRLAALLALRAAGAPETVGRDGRAPVWPAGVRGSISHSAGRAMAVATKSRAALGLDCETMLTEAAAEEIAPIVLTPADQAMKPPGWSEAAFRTAVFSAKEAVYKALSDRMSDIPDFLEASIEKADADGFEIRLRNWLALARVAFDQGDCVALAWAD
ncbi:MAG: 4'-phosphopantetheinyl transferase [Pikeienuella sp.]